MAANSDAHADDEADQDRPCQALLDTRLTIRCVAAVVVQPGEVEAKRKHDFVNEIGAIPVLRDHRSMSARAPAGIVGGDRFDIQPRPPMPGPPP
jgi:hypothetical protein